MRRIAHLFSVIACVVLAVSCSSMEPYGFATIPAKPTSMDVGEYRLGPQDRLQIIVFEQPTLSGEYVINEAGVIAVPLAGLIEAKGLTVRELEKSVRLAFQTSQTLTSPNVAVQLLEARPFYILGEVEDPGSYPFSVGMTVYNAIALAGGHTYRAHKNRVFIRRASEPDERLYVLTPTMRIQPGDTIRIPERLF